MMTQLLSHEVKRGSVELLILALLEERERHGYEMAKLIDRRSRGAITIHAASLYPILYRLEGRRVIEGRWVEKAGQRRRRYYRLTSAGKRTLAAQRETWQAFVQGLTRVARIRPA
ncbi:MAG: PadR family transcriptional regulator [Gemmatimonadota bacterium]